MEGWDRCGDQGREVSLSTLFRLYDTLIDQEKRISLAGQQSRVTMISTVF
jgi:hypothetical protein